MECLVSTVRIILINIKLDQLKLGDRADIGGGGHTDGFSNKFARG